MNQQITTNFSITGITCETCIKLISRRVLTIPGVSDINVSLRGKTSVSADRKIESSELAKVLQGTDYQVN